MVKNPWGQAFIPESQCLRGQILPFDITLVVRWQLRDANSHHPVALGSGSSLTTLHYRSVGYGDITLNSGSFLVLGLHKGPPLDTPQLAGGRKAEIRRRRMWQLVSGK